MSLPKRDPNFTTKQLQEESELFMKAGERYFEAAHKAGIGGAVVWSQGPEGFVLFTRGEYRETILRNIPELGPVTYFGSVTDE